MRAYVNLSYLMATFRSLRCSLKSNVLLNCYKQGASTRLNLHEVSTIPPQSRRDDLFVEIMDHNGTELHRSDLFIYDGSQTRYPLNYHSTLAGTTCLWKHPVFSIPVSKEQPFSITFCTQQFQLIGKCSRCGIDRILRQWPRPASCGTDSKSLVIYTEHR